MEVARLEGLAGVFVDRIASPREVDALKQATSVAPQVVAKFGFAGVPVVKRSELAVDIEVKPLTFFKPQVGEMKRSTPPPATSTQVDTVGELRTFV